MQGGFETPAWLSSTSSTTVCLCAAKPGVPPPHLPLLLPAAAAAAQPHQTEHAEASQPHRALLPCREIRFGTRHEVVDAAAAAAAGGVGVGCRSRRGGGGHPGWHREARAARAVLIAPRQHSAAHHSAAQHGASHMPALRCVHHGAVSSSAWCSTQRGSSTDLAPAAPRPRGGGRAWLPRGRACGRARPALAGRRQPERR